MNRRTVLKGLATLPLATGIASCKDKDDDDRRGAQQLQILLDGAFAVVLQHGKSDSVLAFSPRDMSEPHQFYFNDPGYEQDAKKNYSFELHAEGLRKHEHTEIASGLSDFNARTKTFKPAENFVAIKLPMPRSITFAGHRERVIFNSGKTGWMATNHILEYDVTDAKRISIECSEKGLSCRPSEDSPTGLTRFFFEVGPPRGTPHKHAVNFFNFMLRTSFPDLVEAYSLKDILDKRDERPTTTTARLVSAGMSDDNLAQFRNVSYTLDCKLGGIIATIGG